MGHCSKWLSRWGLLVLWPLAAIALVSLYPILSSSEAREAHIIADIVERGNWFFPTRAGLIPSKPPFFHWLGGAVGAIAGSSAPWVGRFVSILSGVLLAWATMSLARVVTSRWWQTNDVHDDGSADWTVVRLAGLMVFASQLFVNLGVNVRVDMLFAALATFSLSLILPYTRDKQAWRGRGWGVEVAFWSLIGCAVLTRGPVGVVLPTSILFLALWVRVGIKVALLWALLPPITVVLALVVPFIWYLPAAHHWGPPFLARFLFETADRVIGGGQVNAEAWWFYGPSFLRTMFPCSILFLIALVRRGYDRRGLGVLIGWVVTGIVLFSAASGKRHSYLLPLLPGGAIVAAHYLVWEVRRLTEADRERLRRRYGVVEGFFLLIPFVMIIAAWGVAQGWWSIRGGGLVAPLVKSWLMGSGMIVVVVMAGVIGLSIAVRSRGDFLARVSVAVGIVPLVIVAAGLGLKNTVKDFPARTEEIVKRVQGLSEGAAETGREQPPTIVFKDVFEEYLDPVLYYSSIPLQVVNVPRPAEATLSPVFTSILPELSDLLSTQDILGKVPCNRWVLTMPNVVAEARSSGIVTDHYEEFLEPTHRSGVSERRADRTIALVRFQAPAERCLSL